MKNSRKPWALVRIDREGTEVIFLRFQTEERAEREKRKAQRLPVPLGAQRFRFVVRFLPV